MGPRWGALAALACLTAAPAGAEGPEEARQEAFFESKIRPVLVEHCYECHAADSDQVHGGLLVDSREGLRRGGDSGPTVVPHQPDESLLLEALRYEGYEMPPSGRLPDAVIADFAEWIERGAADPRDGTAEVIQPEVDLDAGRSHWAFQPMKRPEVPRPDGAAWVHTDIDRFILQRLEDSGLAPAPDADRHVLLRRLYYDLVGLPPSREALEAFEQDRSPRAVADVVDRLLQSPRFGERWAQHWLDLARFSESTGGGRSLLYGDAWRYRDYVVDSFNNDKPYDRFIREQIAGDLLPYDDPAQGAEQLTATAFLMLGPHNYENQDKELLRMDVIDEQVDVVGRVFLGMTLGCARCHDHKFDPIPTKDYYALAGIFRSTNMLVEGNVSGWTKRPVPVPPAVQEEIDAHRAAVAQREKQLEARQAELKELEEELPTQTIDNDRAKLVGEWTDSRSVNGFVGDGYAHSTERSAAARYEFAPREPGRYEVRISYTPGANRSPDSEVVVRHREGESTEVVDQRDPPPLDGRWRSIGRWEFDDAATVELRPGEDGGHLIADAVQLLWLEPAKPAADQEGAAERLAEQVARVQESIETLQTELDQLKESGPPEPPSVMAVVESEEAGDYYVCVRGNHKNLGDRVPRGVLSVLADTPELEIPDGASGRRELADWIADDDHPLTARVMVNRVWHQLFGAGLVRTVDNFGLPGEHPSHPELLDFLARRFVEEGWSIKALIREIVLSRTYQLSSQRGGAAEAVDPENRLLSRQNRRRRDAESLHDAIHALSGELDLTAGGDTVRPGTRSEYGYRFDSRRRAVYLPVFRNRLPELFTVFDHADPNTSTGRRNTSTIASQALLMLNSPDVMQAADATAARLLAEPDLQPIERIEWLYREAVGRAPSEAEQRIALKFIGEGTDEARWARLCQAVIASIDFLYVQ